MNVYICNGPSWSPVLSADGTKVVFESWASNLDPSGTNGVADVRDVATGPPASCRSTPRHRDAQDHGAPGIADHVR